MADVNLLFPSPIKPSNVIVYGMIRNIGTVAFSMIFMVYQVANMRINLGMTTSMMVWTFACLFLTLLMCLTTSVCFMLICSGRSQRLSILKWILGAVVVVLLLFAIAEGNKDKGMNGFDMFTSICSNRFLDAIPIIGWSRGVFVGLITSKASIVATYGLPCLALLILEVFFVSHTKTDYYEDVLDGASRKEQALQNFKNGKRGFVRRSSKDKTIRKFGINAGSGASTFLYKRMLERKRGAFGIFDFSTLLIAATGIFMTIVLHAPFLAFLGIAAMFSLMLQRINSWDIELTKVYIFLAPAQPEHKLFFILLPELFFSLINSVLVFIIGSVLFDINPLYALEGAIAFLSVCILITGSSVIIRRVFGAETRNSLVQVVAVYLPMIVMGIGMVPAFIVQYTIFATQSFPVFAILIITLWNILASCISLIIGRGVLTKSSGT
jgi:hypothetical protein